MQLLDVPDCWLMSSFQVSFNLQLRSLHKRRVRLVEHVNLIMHKHSKGEEKKSW